jgi:predicted nucleic acid-binding protein
VYLVDTSVWIEVLRRPARVTLESVVAFDEIVTCLPVVQEVLQGFSDERAFLKARSAFEALPIVEAPLAAGVFHEAVGLYRTARRSGVTIRSSIDCLVAACALRHGLTVLHRDRDYGRLAEISPLRVRNLPS